MPEGSEFRIPAHPQRRYHRRGGLEYEGGTVFVLEPCAELSDPSLGRVLEELLEDGPYRWGDFLELPMPLFLVRDDETADVFRVSVRDGTVRLHVLPETNAAGLEAFYERLRGETGAEWRVDPRQEDQ